MSDISLLPCPFCEGEAQRCSNTAYGMFWVSCVRCHASPGDRKSQEEAAAAWNSRIALAPKADDGRAVTLAECPIGLFTCRGELCLKTEYGNNEGRIDAYIVSSGEFFWGAAPQTIASQRAQMVVPVEVATLSVAPNEGQIS